jgi:chromosome segregation ATPase
VDGEPWGNLARTEVLLDPTIIAITTAAGALFGTAVGILLFRRKMRPPITDSELADLKVKVQTGESSLATASANLEDLRKQIALQERALLQNGEDLKKRQEQLDAQSAETQKEKARRSAAEQSVQEISAKAVLLTEQCAKLEAGVRESQSLVAQQATQLASAADELSAEKRKIQELTEQTAHLTSESAEFKRVGEQEARLRGLLEVQLNAEQERIRQITVRVSELETERLQLEIKLQEESRSAAKGLELLVMAQENLASAFKSLGTGGPNGNHSETPVKAAEVAPEAKTEASEVARAASVSSK